MPRHSPHLSITLPRNFTFPRTEPSPHTPSETQIPPQAPDPPRVERPFRLKRRLRSNVSALWQKGPRDSTPANGSSCDSELPIPSIETHNVPLYKQDVLRPSTRYLTPTLQIKRSLPCTPEPTQQTRPPKPEDLGESIIRPLSTCSILSDSSDDSYGSASSLPAGDGSCTSPESDAPDPFASIKRQSINPQKRQRWTPDMDRHLWMTYLAYLQDPTVTPFKMLPGVAPPLGVCHRVARQAKRTWRPSRSTSETSVERTAWPKSGSSTRRRLRLLCRRKPSIAPHYQRLLQSRSPSPVASHPFAPTRSRSRMSEVTTSNDDHTENRSPYNTRQVQISLTTSTADSMQPSGPLAQLCEPEGLFASEITPPSDATLASSPLGTPFEMESPNKMLGFNTWGPSRSTQRPPLDMSEDGPALQPPVRLSHHTMPHSRTQKRRALHQLEENAHHAEPTERHRKIRSRGFSLGDIVRQDQLDSVSNSNRLLSQSKTSNDLSGVSLSTEAAWSPTYPFATIRRLESPFQGGQRRSSRHMATTSLGTLEHSGRFLNLDNMLQRDHS